MQKTTFRVKLQTIFITVIGVTRQRIAKEPRPDIQEKAIRNKLDDSSCHGLPRKIF